ncbi:AAA family ATPase [Mycobacteroides chelonae]|uniref:AAA family ATPase n=1 Tax=Mycobacteroides chelonae TaxID=1774 RepID=UPI0039E83048
MTTAQDTKGTGIEAGSISEVNGADPLNAPSGPYANGAVVQEEPPSGIEAEAFPWLMAADRLGAEPGDEIAEYLTPGQWETVRQFARSHGVTITAPNAAIERDGTRFEELDHAPLPAELAAVVCPDLEGTTRAEVLDFINDSVLHSISDPEPALAKLVESAQARKRERAQAHQALNRVEVRPGEVVSIDPGTEYALDEVERVAGVEVADAARRAIEQCNRRAWSHPKPHNFREHTFLATAGELVNHGVAATDIAKLSAATDDDRDAALEQLGIARQRHRDDITSRARAGEVPALDLSTEVLTLSGLSALEPVRPLIEGFIPGGQLTDLNGQPGSGKTMAAVSMAAAVASGTRWCGHAVGERAAVLYIAAEGAAGIRARLLAWCEVNGVAPEDIEDTFIIAPRAVQMGDDGHMQQVRDLVKRHEIALVVFDTRARCTVGVEENSATDHGRVISRADDINQQTGAAVLVVHHTAAGSDRARGTTAWDGGVWSSLLLARVGGKKSKSRKIELTCAKHKEWPDKCTHQFLLVEHTVSEALMPGATTGQRSTLVMSGVDPMVAADDEALSTGETHAEILALTAELGGGEGLTKSEIVRFALERSLCSRSGAYSAITALTDKGKKLVKVPGTQRLAAHNLIEGAPDKDGITAVGSAIYTAAVDDIIKDLCLRKAEGRITDETSKTDAHKLVGGHVTPFAEAWARWSATRPIDSQDVDKLKNVSGKNR